MTKSERNLLLIVAQLAFNNLENAKTIVDIQNRAGLANAISDVERETYKNREVQP